MNNLVSRIHDLPQPLDHGSRPSQNSSLPDRFNIQQNAKTLTKGP